MKVLKKMARMVLTQVTERPLARKANVQISQGYAVRKGVLVNG